MYKCLICRILGFDQENNFIKPIISAFFTLGDGALNDQKELYFLSVFNLQALNKLGGALKSFEQSLNIYFFFPPDEEARQYNVLVLVGALGNGLNDLQVQPALVLNILLINLYLYLLSQNRDRIYISPSFSLLACLEWDKETKWNRLQLILLNPYQIPTYLFVLFHIFYSFLRFLPCQFPIFGH